MSTGFAHEDNFNDDDDDDDDIEIVWGEEKRDTNLPAGVYPVTIIDATHQISKNGNKMLVLVAEVSEGEHKGRWLWEHIAYLPSVEFKLKQVIGALMGVGTGTQKFKRQELLHRSCNVLVEESEYNGKATNDIIEWLPADDDQKDDGKPKEDAQHSAGWDVDF